MKGVWGEDSTRQAIQNYVLSGGRVDDETSKFFIQRVYFVLQSTLEWELLTSIDYVPQSYKPLKLTDGCQCYVHSTIICWLIDSIGTSKTVLPSMRVR
jgi:hypothetical protein